MSINKITDKNAKRMLEEKNAVIIDVRTLEEYKECHIKGCKLIALKDIYNTDELPTDKDTNIIAYCKSGIRSHSFLAMLLEMGYKNLYNLGGIKDWNYDIVKGD